MRLKTLSLGGLRVFAEASFCPAPGLSWLTGPNGAGKTSVLEGAYALTHARSFRSAQFDAVVRSSADSAVVFSEWEGSSGALLRMGSARAKRGGWEYRIDGVQRSRVADLAERAPMLCFEPGSHQVVSGTSERRRRLLDWGVFHVERLPASLWLEWQRVLRQRNEALRLQSAASLAAFDPLLAEIGERLHAGRRAFVERWLDRSRELLGALSPGLEAVDFSYRPGWGRGHEHLRDALEATRERDLAQGFTFAGPHRADILIRSEGGEARERLSRGQSKLVALSLVLGLAECLHERRGVLPLLLLDDLCSELDRARAQCVLEYLRSRRTQALITGVEAPAWAKAAEDAVFHVERGRIDPLL